MAGAFLTADGPLIIMMDMINIIKRVYHKHHYIILISGSDCDVPLRLNAGMIILIIRSL
jgi:hypothetical protein